MKAKAILLTFAAMFIFAMSAEAQSLPRPVRNVEVQTLNGETARLPWWKEKNLLIFYVDPEVPKQNDEFINYLESTQRLYSPNMEGFGIVNLKDAWYPNSLVCQIADARTAKNGATILCDPDHWFSNAWRLGDCNDSFVIILVSKDGELEYVHKGEMDEAEQQRFLQKADELNQRYN